MRRTGEVRCTFKLVSASDFELAVDCSVERECCCHGGNGDPIFVREDVFLPWEESCEFLFDNLRPLRSFVTIAKVIMSNVICALVFAERYVGMLSAMGHTERASFLKRPSRPDPGAFVTRRHSHQDD